MFGVWQTVWRKVTQTDSTFTSPFVTTGILLRPSISRSLSYFKFPFFQCFLLESQWGMTSGHTKISIIFLLRITHDQRNKCDHRNIETRCNQYESPDWQGRRDVIVRSISNNSFIHMNVNFKHLVADTVWKQKSNEPSAYISNIFVWGKSILIRLLSGARKIRGIRIFLNFANFWKRRKSSGRWNHQLWRIFIRLCSIAIIFIPNVYLNAWCWQCKIANFHLIASRSLICWYYFKIWKLIFEIHPRNNVTAVSVALDNLIGVGKLNEAEPIGKNFERKHSN